jgi:general stress protein 26
MDSDMGTTKNLSDQEGREKLKELVDSARMCHFVTELDAKPLTSRPMATQEVDEEGNLWFFSGKSSHKNKSIAVDPEVQLFYAQTGSSEYLTVFGHAEIIDDQDKTDKLWSPWVKTWFNEGKEDPELTLIRVRPHYAHYWDTKNNRAVQLVKILVGAIVGKQLDDGIEGNIVV